MLFFLIMGDENVEVIKTAASSEGKEVIKEGKTRKARDIVIPGEYHETSLVEDVPEENIEESLTRLMSFVDSLDLPQEDTETADEDLANVDLTDLSMFLEQQDPSTSADSEEITTPSPSEPGK
ncbi:hypothetical protein Pcinc_012931 [Petrolisthes cinctipes]|uniref:Uncharacterized protein n=1 Tax=Petrolisthes cinctipes TaxID=88211 RepID=A0AAE1KQX4_PETCI|nr:hypothetical protein Pcinc_012931 [Petrolisthes cinctipes]